MFIIDFGSLLDNISCAEQRTDLLYSYSSIHYKFYITIEINLEFYNKQKKKECEDLVLICVCVWNE